MTEDQGITGGDLLTIMPLKARLDVSTSCQLRCTLCPTDEHGGRSFLGQGMMALAGFIRFLEENQHIREVELANAGEALLNPDLPAMLRCAAERGVSTNLGGGVNMNDASDEVLDALVRYRTRRLRISVDGTSEETYRRYRVNGSLRRVLANIQRLNEVKRRYRSERPELVLQFILFGHNEHELEKAHILARMLDMKLFVKMNRSPDQLAIRDRERIRQIYGFADREEFRKVTGMVYCRSLCLCLWREPQVNWDGRLLGCPHNKHSFFAGQVLGRAFLSEINNERMMYARKMLLGEAPPRDDIPCSSCSWYLQMRKHSLWITPSEVQAGTLPLLPQNRGNNEKRGVH
jgi:MoaA/NifB/PqqE/SkfB family radical SAM enzyme